LKFYLQRTCQDLIMYGRVGGDIEIAGGAETAPADEERGQSGDE